MRIIKDRIHRVAAEKSLGEEHKYTVRAKKRIAGSQEDYVDEVSRNSAAVSDTAKTDNIKYLTALADGVLKEINTHYEDIGEMTYDIFDTVIIFSLDSEVVFIQPIDQIIYKWSDLDDDIMDLAESIGLPESVGKEPDNTQMI